MTVQNACLIFILAFSAVTGWLMSREPAQITVAGAERAPSKQVAEPKSDVTENEAPEVALSNHQSSVLSRLDSIIIPVVDLKNATLEESIEFLRLRAIELAPDRDAPLPSISFIIKNSSLDGQTEDKLINLYYEEISVTEALNHICEEVGYQWEIDDYDVILLPN